MSCMDTETESVSDDAASIPDRAPCWSDLHDRAPYSGDSIIGGVLVHRCHPDGDASDYVAFAMRYESMDGCVDKKTYLYGGPVETGDRPAMQLGCTRWDDAVDSFHVREGSHEDCAVCQGTADRRELLREVMETATDQVGGEHNVARTAIYDRSSGSTEYSEGIVYLDSHGQRASGSKPADDSENRPSMGTESGPYSVDNSTRHWEGRVVSHPYVQFAGAEEVGVGGNWSSPDDTLRVSLKTWYPRTMPEVKL